MSALVSSSSSRRTVFSHMRYNADGKAHSLVFAGTNLDLGNWWFR